VTELAAGAVHVWYVDLDGDPPAGTDAGACLDPAERDRAARLVRASDQARYVASHCATRHLLAPYLGCSAGAIRVSRLCVHCGDPKHGKPVLTPPSGELVVETNLSHSGGLAAVAVAAPPLRVGVDVELRRPDVDWAHILPGGLPGTGADGFTAWTRIEAVTKAAGTGIISLPAVPGEPAAPGGWTEVTLPKDGGSWQVRSLEPPAGYAAALAASAVPAQVSVRWFR
jgi:4'-phosphopantetheinyl transferase